MLSYAFVDAFTRVERPVAIARMKNAIADAERVIVDFEAGDVHLFDRCAIALDRNAARPSSRKPVLAMLHVAFTSDELLSAAV